MKVTMISGVELARYLDISPRRVGQLAEEGVLDRRDGKFDLTANLKRYFRRQREQIADRTTAEGSIDPVHASARLSRERALLQQKKTAQLQADLVPASVIDSAASAISVFFRGRATVLADRLRNVVLAHGGTKREASLVGDDVLRTLDELGRDMARATTNIGVDVVNEMEIPE